MWSLGIETIVTRPRTSKSAASAFRINRTSKTPMFLINAMFVQETLWSLFTIERRLRRLMLYPPELRARNSMVSTQPYIVEESRGDWIK
jgi:hypothetical protein